MKQVSFFDRRPEPADCGPVPRVDVQTSIEAAAKIEPQAGLMREKVLQLLQDRKARGATDEELSFVLVMKLDTARARRCELRDGGLVRDSGHRRPTACGRLSIIWVASETSRVQSPESRVESPNPSTLDSRPSTHKTGGGVDARTNGRGAVAPAGVHAGGGSATIATGQAAGQPCRCGSRETVEVPIHGGQSTRIDCKKCGRFVRFGRWHGQEAPS